MVKRTKNLTISDNWGPYFTYGINAGNEIRIAWKSEDFVTEHWVEFGLDENHLTKIESGWHEPTQMPLIILKDLMPSTKYIYRISRKGDGDKWYSFKTGPQIGSKETIEFTMTGDMHAYPANDLTKYFDLMPECAPNHDFLITVGDCINNGLDLSHWQAFFRDANEYFESHGILNATGNHDTNNQEKYARYISTWYHPYADPKNGAYYYIEFGNVVFIFIDSSNAGKGWESTPLDEQYEWLEETLEKFSKKDRWIFLFLHHQVISTGDFGTVHMVHEFYRDLTQEYHVDGIFYGHDHHYESFWVDGDEDWGGTLYCVTGAGGGQKHIDHGIMGKRDGITKYVWPGRVLNVREMGVPAPTEGMTGTALGARNDDLIKKTQLLGILEPNFLHIKIEGDELDLKVIGWNKIIYHHLHFKRTGTGKKFNEKTERIIYPKDRIFCD